MEGHEGKAMAFRQWALGIGLMAVIAGGLTACGGQPASAPPTTAPAVTEIVPPTAPASPAAGAATPAPAGEATVVAASPVAATPVAGRGSATPVAAVNPERLAAACADYNAWRNSPEVKAALDKMSLWPEVIAEGEKAAAGQPVDTALMQKDFAQMEDLAKQLRTTNDTTGDHAPLQLSGRAMGLTSRLAGGLATGSLDAKGAAEAVAAAKEAIAAYQDDAAKRQAECGG
jgi:hypothetical protein